MKDFTIEIWPTASMNNLMAQDEKAAKIIYDSIAAFLRGDYGPAIGEEDTRANNRDRESNQGRAIGRYSLEQGDIYIIEYYPRQGAPKLHILFCTEY